jgi:four helix bundle protein
MTETQSLNGNSKVRQYDLEDRTLHFAKEVVIFVDKLPKILTNTEISKQLIRAAGSVGANYIEATNHSARRFHYEDKNLRKEAKEARYWLKLLTSNCNEVTCS